MNLTNHRSADALSEPSMPVDRGRGMARRTPRWARSVALGIVAALGIAAPCRAGGLVISAPDITATAGSSGSFLVLITDTDPTGSAPYNVAGDSFELILTGSAGINFTNVTTATDVAPYNTPYIYAHSIANDYSLPLYTSPTNPFPTTDFTAADSFDLSYSAGYTTLNPGDVYALGLVSYTVSATATAGSVDTIGFGASTSLSDNNLNAIPFTTTNGSIAVASVPEPSTWAMGMIAIAGGSLIFGSRRWLISTSRPRSLM
ncbi:MAG TPA: PEP-CTERM sorting domain-containing protein [Isosphaeraceae bacterium]|nr:PEP-CTERM sorting domain-containing protein [Isosphaeraceae bacterium]